MITIYHNPRCSKSRQGLEFLMEKSNDWEIIDYIKTGISEEKLTETISLLKIKPIELVRTSENIWKENYKGKELTDQEIIKILTQNPKLIQRPIIINGKKAVIGRPTEIISKIL